jgi:Tol biopolymer transport system component
MTIVSPIIRLVATALCFSVFGISEPLSRELQHRAANEGLALVRIHGEPVTILQSNGELITQRNPRVLSSAWLSNGGAATVWSIYYLPDKSPWASCPTPLIVESRGGLDSWKLPGGAISVTAGVSPDGKSVAFFGTYKPPGSEMLNTTDNRSSWVAGLFYSSRGAGVNVVFTNATPAFGATPAQFPINSISWSPDASAFAYDYQGKIYIFDVLGKTSRVIASGSSPDWSPDGHWIAFRSAEGMAYAIDPVTHRGRDLFGNRQILAGVHWSPDSSYVMLSERLGFVSNILHLRDPFLTGVMLVIRVRDGDSVPVGWIGLETPDDRGFDWVSDHRTFLERAAVKPIVQGCE